MSDLPPPPPATAPADPSPLPPPAETPPPPPPAAGASATPTPAPEPSLPPPAALKPLLNPLQAEGSAPQSTIAEAARSPNPANPAVDEGGRNIELAPTAATTPAPVGPEGEGSGVAGEAGAGVRDPSQAPASASVQMVDQPPLPIDAPVPPSPPAPKDEPVPSLPGSAIPSAVPTPTVIAVESPSLPAPAPADIQSLPSAAEVTPAQHIAPPASEQPAAPEPTPAATPAPATSASASLGAPAIPAQPSASASPAPPAPAAAAPALPAAAPVPASASLSPAPLESSGAQPHAGSDGMDLDADGEDEVPAPAPAAGSNINSLKRAGDELSGPDEKRAREQNGSAAPAAPLAASAPASGSAPYPAGANGGAPANPAIAYVPINYQPPAPRNPGPRTKLTQTQHKHLLGAVRNIKRMAPQVSAFLAPVDTVLYGIPHYFKVVKKPMDLGTVETKLIASNPRGPPKDKSKMGNWDESKGTYGSVAEVTEDVRQIWENTRMFNGPDHVVSQNATVCEAAYEKALKNLPAEPASPAPSPAPPASAGPSQVRRPSISQAPAPRRSEDNTDRPKREIHPPPPKELPYTDAPRKPKRRADPQVTWTIKQLTQLEKKNPVEMAPFLYPVGELIRLVAGYERMIRKPIDLNIIKSRIQEGEYETPQQIDSDMKLMFKNAITFNPPDHEVFKYAKAMQVAWNERFRELPPKEVPRGLSEEPGVDEMIAEEVEEDFESDAMIQFCRKQIKTLEQQISDRTAELRKQRGAAAPKKSKPAPVRKQSTASAAPKQSPAPNGASSSHSHAHSSASNGNAHAAPAPAPSPAPKKPRKSKDVSYKDDDGGYGDSDEEPEMSMTQKQELAEKIQVADGDTLNKAIKIIQSSTGLDGANDEIELDIDMLPPKVVSQLYNLVCRGGAPRRNGPGRPKGQSAVVGGKKPGRKATGGYNKRSMNEQEEAERIARMEAQLQSFDAPAAGGAGGYESESSEEDESEEE